VIPRSLYVLLCFRVSDPLLLTRAVVLTPFRDTLTYSFSVPVLFLITWCVFTLRRKVKVVLALHRPQFPSFSSTVLEAGPSMLGSLLLPTPASSFSFSTIPHFVTINNGDSFLIGLVCPRASLGNSPLLSQFRPQSISLLCDFVDPSQNPHQHL